MTKLFETTSPIVLLLDAYLASNANVRLTNGNDISQLILLCIRLDLQEIPCATLFHESEFNEYTSTSGGGIGMEEGCEILTTL